MTSHQSILTKSKMPKIATADRRLFLYLANYSDHIFIAYQLFYLQNTKTTGSVFCAGYYLCWPEKL